MKGSTEKEGRPPQRKGTTMPKGMLLTAALTIHPQVFSYDAGKDPSEVIIERFFDPSLKPGSGVLLDACQFGLSVIRQGKIEDSWLCVDWEDLVRTLMVLVHGGRELRFGEHWIPISERHVLPDDRLSQLVRGRHIAIQQKITLLENMIDKQDRGQCLIAPALARTWLKELREIGEELYQNAKGTEND